MPYRIVRDGCPAPPGAGRHRWFQAVNVPGVTLSLLRSKCPFCAQLDARKRLHVVFPFGHTSLDHRDPLSPVKFNLMASWYKLTHFAIIEYKYLVQYALSSNNNRTNEDDYLRSPT